MQQFSSPYRHSPAPQLANAGNVALPAHHPAWGSEVVPLAQRGPADVREQGPAAWADVAGGVAFACFVGLLVAKTGDAVVNGSSSWATAIGIQTVWLVASALCALVLPLGIRPVTDLRSALRGLSLDWPELLISTKFTIDVAAGAAAATLWGPLGLSLAVGASEEFIFRVLLLGWLVTRLPAEKALVVSSLVFGLAHLHEVSLVGMMSVTPQFAGGMILGAMYLRTRNIIGPIVAHALWDLPVFWAYGNGISGGGTDGGMPSMTSFWDFWLWLGLAAYGLWLVRPGIPLPGRNEQAAPHPG